MRISAYLLVHGPSLFSREFYPFLGRNGTTSKNGVPMRAACFPGDCECVVKNLLRTCLVRDGGLRSLHGQLIGNQLVLSRAVGRQHTALAIISVSAGDEAVGFH